MIRPSQSQPTKKKKKTRKSVDTINSLDTKFFHYLPSLTKVYKWCDYTLPLFRILSLGVILASRCLWSRPAWIVFFLFCCWVTKDKQRGGVWWGPALCAGWRQLWAASPAPTLSLSCDTLSKQPLGLILLHFSA